MLNYVNMFYLFLLKISVYYYNFLSQSIIYCILSMCRDKIGARAIKCYVQ